MTRTTIWAAMEWLFKIAQRAPFNIAPERGAELATEVFGEDKWAIERSVSRARQGKADAGVSGAGRVRPLDVVPVERSARVLSSVAWAL